MSNIKLIKGSSVNQNVDAIVNAANKYLAAGGGVCGAIFSKAGYSELTEECSKYSVPLQDGEAVITSSCNITSCKYIIHAVGPDFNVKPKAFKELFEAYYNSLCVLKENDLHSISFPLISSGIFGGNLDNPVYESAKQCIRAYNSFVKNNPEYDVEVLLCCFQQKEFNEAEKVFAQ